MPIEALLAILTSAGIILLVVGLDRAVRHDRTALDKRLRRYGGRAYQLTDEEQKQAASAAVTQLLAKRVEASISGRTFAAALQTDLARANLKLTVGEFLIMQVAAAAVIGMLAWLISGALFVGSIFGAVGWFIPKVWLGRRVASDDLELLVIAILVQFEIGGNLSRILDSIASTIRERVKLQGEIRTMSAQGRMAGWVLSGLPVAIGGLLMLIAPSYMGALFTPGPWLALPAAALIGIVMGSFVINKLVAIEV